jgi:hypothetical protein
MNQLATRFPKIFCSWLHKHNTGYLTNNTHNCVLWLTSNKNTHAQQKYYWFLWSLLEYFPVGIVTLSYSGPVSITLALTDTESLFVDNNIVQWTHRFCAAAASAHWRCCKKSCGLGCHQHRTLVARELHVVHGIHSLGIWWVAEVPRTTRGSNQIERIFGCSYKLDILTKSN